jgi:hypothetical protein
VQLLRVALGSSFNFALIQYRASAGLSPFGQS